MKTIIIVFLILIAYSVVFAQYSNIYKEETNIKGESQLSETMQFQIVVKKIMRDYGKSFVYFNELQKGLFRFEVKDKNSYSLVIVTSKGDVVKTFYLYKKKINGIYSLLYNRHDIEECLAPIVLGEQNNTFFATPPPETIIESNNMLLDKIIIEVPDYRDFKVFNKSFAEGHLVDQDGIRSSLYKLLLEAKILPYYDSIACEYIPKVISVDPLMHNIQYGDQNYDIFSGEYVSKYYCRQGNDDNELSYPTGITFGQANTSGVYTIFPVYVADQHNNRIIKADFKVIDNGGEAFFDENSFEVVSKAVRLPYDVELYETPISSNNKIWVSEYFDNGSLICLNSNGSIQTKIKGYRYTYNYQEYYTIPFEAGATMRIAIYQPMNCFAFIYSIPGTNVNEICTFLLDSNGVPASMANDTIVNVWREHFNSNYPLTSVNFQNIKEYSAQYPYMWITSGGFNPPSPYSNMVHGFAINSTANFIYLGSTGKPRNTDWYFHNLLNTTTGLGYYDLYTIEEWSDAYGLRKYYPFADFHSVQLTNYCEDSTNMLQWNAAFTNDCFIKVWVERKKNDSKWELVEIKQIDGMTQPSGTYYPIIFRYKGYTALTKEDPIEIKLNLPLKDYTFGGQLRLQARLYPDYDPAGTGDYTETPVYEIPVSRNCLPKPGGCPFLYVKNENQNYIADNNVLHKSEFVSGDITDRYKLQVIPYLDLLENTVEMYLVENENDVGYINTVKLYAIDYPTNKKMAITENNETVLYDSAGVLASDSVTLNDASITNLVNYYNPDTVNGYIDDSLYAHFSNPDRFRILKSTQNNSHSDINVPNDRIFIGKEYFARNEYSQTDGPGGPPKTRAFISLLGNLPYPNTANKTWAGSLTASSIFSHEVTKNFSRRELPSLVVVPLFADTDKVDYFNIHWQSDFEMNYLGIANIAYDGFTSTEAPLSSSSYITASAETDIIGNLLYADSLYGDVSSSGLIKMKFDVSNLPVVGDGYTREYIIEVNGRYERGTDILNRLNHEQIPLTFKLSQNYPNPFNPITKINYELPKNTNVKIVIYDILGREVISLVKNEFKQAGRYTVEFNGQDYASGVYFYRIEAGSFVQAKKMVLVK